MWTSQELVYCNINDYDLVLAQINNLFIITWLFEHSQSSEAWPAFKCLLQGVPGHAPALSELSSGLRDPWFTHCLQRAELGPHFGDWFRLWWLMNWIFGSLSSVDFGDLSNMSCEIFSVNSGSTASFQTQLSFHHLHFSQHVMYLWESRCHLINTSEIYARQLLIGKM